MPTRFCETDGKTGGALGAGLGGAKALVKALGVWRAVGGSCGGSHGHFPLVANIGSGLEESREEEEKGQRKEGEG